MPHTDDADPWTASAEPAYPDRDAVAAGLILPMDVPATAPSGGTPGAPAARVTGKLHQPLQAPADDPQRPLAIASAPEVIDLIELPQALACLTSWRTTEPEARACIRGLSLATLPHVLGNPALHDTLPRLVPLLKVSHVVPCLQAPGMATLLVPRLDPSQCKLVGPELAALIAPYLPLNWRQLDHLPLETLVVMPTATFALLPVPVLKGLPTSHRHYLAPYVNGARKVSHDDHDLALCQGLSEILHLHVHKVLDPEHIPELPQLRAVQRRSSLRPQIQRLRWLVDAVMAPSVEAVQVSSLKIATLIVALRKVGLTGLAGELESSIPSRSRGQRHCAGGISYAQDRVITVQHAAIGELPPPARADALRDALDDTFERHAGMHEQLPLPGRHCVPVVCIELAAAPPSSAGKWQELEAVLHEQLGNPCNGVAIQEVHLRWADATTAVYRRHGDGRYRRW